MSLRPEFEQFLRLLSRAAAPRVLEIGSHHGDGVLAMLEQNEDLDIIAVEADIYNYGKLIGRVPPQVDCRCMAIASVSGKAKVHCFSGNDSRNSSLFKEVGKVRKTKGKVDTVSSFTLDELCDGMDIDFIRFDCYGAEYEIFWHGLPETVRNASVVLLAFHWKKGLFDTEKYAGIRKRVRIDMLKAGFRIEAQSSRKKHKHQHYLWVKED